MLPVPFDRLMTQPMQYPPGNPPAMLQFNVPPNFQSYTGMIAAAVANEFSSKAQANFIRMFVFNLVSQNNWQNQYYQEAVSVAGYLMAWMARTSGPQSAISNIMTVAQRAVEMYIGKCIVAFPDFRQYVDPSQYQAAQQSYGQMENLMLEVNQMYQQPQQMGGYQQPMMAPQMPMGGGMGQYPMQGMQPVQPQMTPSVGFTGPGMGQTNFGMPVQSGHGMPTERPAAANIDARYGGRTKNIAVETKPPAVPMKPIAPIPAPEIPSTNNQGAKMPTSLREVETMDRNQHTIHFANDLVAINRSKREFLATERAENLGKDLKPVKDGNLCIHVYDKTLIQSSFDELISESRVMQQQFRLDDKEAGIFRANAVVASLFITPENYGDEIRKIVQQKTLTDIGNSLTEAYKKIGGAGSEDKVRGLVMLERLNKRLTWFVNQFLRVEMDLQVSIESFMEDAKDLYGFVVSKYGSEYGQFMDRMTYIINNAFMPEIDQAEQMLRDCLLDDSGVTATLLMESVSLTLVDLMYRELGFDLKPNVSYLITEDQQLLHLLARKIEYGNPMDHLVEHSHYLVTLDDVKLTLHRSLVHPDQYLVALA